MNINKTLKFYKNKYVLVTGHTGFKGSWLCLWLKKLGANVSGISIDIPSGINGDTGKVCGCAVRANKTLALHGKKTGHTLYPGKKYCGKIITRKIYFFIGNKF